MKKIIFGVIILFVLAAPLLAQGSFSDVPTDHWAYDAVNKLQQDGIVIGYPNGTFSGNRPLTRFEFAAALARAIPVLEERITNDVLAKVPAAQGGVSQDQFNSLQNRVSALEAAKPAPGSPQDMSGYVTKQDFASLQQLVNEFKDELAGIGVDVDAMKRDIAALAARVAVLEKRDQLFHWGVDFMAVGVATESKSSNLVAAYDRDSRPLQPSGLASGKLINNVSVIRDFDLNLTSSVSPSLSVNADINFGNYMTYLGGMVNDYVGNFRDLQIRTPVAGFSDSTDAFFPYYMNMTAGLGKGSLKIGRMPVQLSPYTLKLIDVDSYTVNDKTDSGNYPLDGAMLNYKFGPVGLMAFADKTDQNALLGGEGLVSQPTAGLYTSVAGVYTGAPFYTLGGAPVATGHAAGGLTAINQVGGARLSIGTPFKGTLGATYMSAVGPAAGYDRVDVWGADLNAQLASFPIALEYSKSTTKDDAHVGVGLAKINDNSAAMDGKIGWGVGKFNIDGGYRDIGNNFGAPGYWAKVGRWTNPTNVKGFYTDLTYGLVPSLSLVANGQFYKGKKTFGVGVLPAVIDETGDKVWDAQGGLKWGFASGSNLSLGLEYVRWDPNEIGSTKTNEKYINIGLGHQINPSVGVNISYQIVDYKPGTGVTPYGVNSYKGGVAVAEVKTKF